MFGLSCTLQYIRNYGFGGRKTIMTKPCKQCKKPMVKPKWRSRKQWDKIQVHKKCAPDYYYGFGNNSL